MQYTDKEVDQ